MGMLGSMGWLGKLLHNTRSTPRKAGLAIHPPRVAAFPPASQHALRRLVSHASLHDCRQARRAWAASVAKAKGQDDPSMRPAHHESPSVDLQQYTHSDAAGREPFAEDVAERNVLAKGLLKGKRSRTSVWWRPDDRFETYATYTPRQLRHQIATRAQALQRPSALHALDVPKEPRAADALPWTPRSQRLGSPVNILAQAAPRRSDLDTVHASIIALPARLRSISRKKSVADLRHAHTLHHKRSQTFPGALRQAANPRRPITQADLNKPLPPLPVSGDTSIHTDYLPAVTHHTIRRDVHHLHQDQVTHEYRQDEYEHRVLPIVDTEILPARHFIQLDGGGLEEIAEEDLPGELPPDLQQRISEAAATIFPAWRDSGYASLDGAFDFGRSTSPRDSVTPEGVARRNPTTTYSPTFLPMRNGTESFHQMLFHLAEQSGGGVSGTHMRSFSDGPPIVPPRGVRQADVLSVASL